jgi:hypothetical protein
MIFSFSFVTYKLEGEGGGVDWSLMYKTLFTFGSKLVRLSFHLYPRIRFARKY